MAYAQHLLANKFMRLHINLQLLSLLVACSPDTHTSLPTHSHTHIHVENGRDRRQVNHIVYAKRTKNFHFANRRDLNLIKCQQLENSLSKAKCASLPVCVCVCRCGCGNLLAGNGR